MKARLKPLKLHLMQLIFLIAFVFYLALGRGSRLYYCQRCGLLRHEQGYVWAKLPLNATWQARYKETEHQKLYNRFISKRCGHIWRRYSTGYSPVGLLGAASAGWGYLPPILSSGNGQRLKKRIEGEDAVTAATILHEYDLIPYYAKRNAN